MFRLTINTDNAAFESEGHELARILRNLATRLAVDDRAPGESCSYPIMDANGNRVGVAYLGPED